MKEIRTGNFAGRSFKFIAHDVASILAQPGAMNITGVATTPDQAAHSSWWSFEDERSVRERHWYFRPGEVVLDIGPAFGSYSLPAAAQGATVYALEPCEFCRSVLIENIALNPDLAARIHVIPVGVHERSGWFEPDAGEFVPEKKDGDKRQLLQVKSIDDIVSELGLERIDCFKLDVEGAEYGAFLGAERRSSGSSQGFSSRSTSSSSPASDPDARVSSTPWNWATRTSVILITASRIPSTK